MIKNKQSVTKILLSLLLILFCFPFITQNVQASGIVSKRLAEARKMVPAKSRLNGWLRTSSIIKEGRQPEFTLYDNGGCNALVTFATMKVFHNAYVPNSFYYKKIGTAKTTSSSGMKKLFSKAKIGDVIVWHKGSNGHHYAIYLSKYSNGIKVYEANVDGKNKVADRSSWAYSQMKYSSYNATKVSVYRSDNYNAVDSGKVAQNYGKGATFTHKGITYKVTKAGIRNAAVKVIKKEKGIKSIPKAIGVNYDTAERMDDYFNKYHDYFAYGEGDACRIRTYNKNKKKNGYINEQYFAVKR